MLFLLNLSKILSTNPIPLKPLCFSKGIFPRIFLQFITQPLSPHDFFPRHYRTLNTHTLSSFEVYSHISYWNDHIFHTGIAEETFKHLKSTWDLTNFFKVCREFDNFLHEYPTRMRLDISNSNNINNKKKATFQEQSTSSWLSNNI